MPSFLLVSLNMDAILGEVILYMRRKNPDEMTKGESLGEAYAATLLRMKEQPGRRLKLSVDVLMWVSHSERPLHIDELCHALGEEGGSSDSDILDILGVGTLLGSL